MDVKKEVERWKNDFHAADTPERIENHKLRFNEFISSLSENDKKTFREVFTADARKALSNAKELVKEVNIKNQLEDINDIISFSYIAEHYFGKTKTWLYQRINGNIVNGKPAKFTEEEIDTLKKALEDISGKIKNTSRSIA